MLTKVMPPTWFLVALTLMAMLHLTAPGQQLVEGLPRTFGFVLLVLGLIFTVVSARQFERRKTPIKPFTPPTTLVTEGTFRYSRNPMYLGFVLVLGGLGLCFGSSTPWLAFIGFVLSLEYVFIRPEERLLALEFPEQYAVYVNATRRWL